MHKILDAPIFPRMSPLFHIFPCRPKPEKDPSLLGELRRGRQFRAAGGSPFAEASAFVKTSAGQAT